MSQDDFRRGEIWSKRRTGELYAALQPISVVRDAHRKLLLYVRVFTEITQIKCHGAAIDRVNNDDALAGLPTAVCCLTVCGRPS